LLFLVNKKYSKPGVKQNITKKTLAKSIFASVFLGKLKICSVILFKEFIKVHFKVQYKTYINNVHKSLIHIIMNVLFYVGINERKMI
jgi:hypothetical protein